MATKNLSKKSKKTTLKKASKKSPKKKTASPMTVSGGKRAVKQSKNGISPLIKVIVHGMQEKKASNIRWLNLKNIPNCSFDHFLICHADNKIQVKAISESVEETVKKELKIHPHHVEGRENAEWIILDYMDVVAHIFLGEKRFYYNLEGFWGDAVSKDIPS